MGTTNLLVLDRDDASPETVPADPEPYRCAGMVRFPFDEAGRVQLVYLPHCRTVRRMSVEDLKLVRFCARFADLSTHAQDFCQTFRLPSTESAPIVETLRGFVESELLLPRSSLLATGLEPACRDTGKITTIAVPTENRPAQAAHCLASYAKNALRYGRPIEYLVADGSQRHEANELTKSMLSEVAREYHVPVFYAGYREKVEYCRALARTAGVPVDLLEFALMGDKRWTPRTGGNRNTILLDRIGEMVFSVDDDTVCLSARMSPDAETETVAFEGERDPTEYWFFPDRAQALSSVRFTECDVIGLHENILGRNTSALAAQYCQSADFDLLCKHLLHGLQQGSGRVLATFSGLLGDSGMYCAAGILSRTGGTRERLLWSEAAYRSALISRELFRAAPRTTISDGGATMSTFMGLDNREFLPPFMPVLRCQDGVFGTTLRKSLDNSCFGYLPIALLHEPPSGRSYGSDAITSIAHKRFCDLLTACMASFRYPPRPWNSREKLVHLGKHLIALAELGQSDFDEFLWPCMRDQSAATVRFLEELLKRFDAKPDFWALDVKRQIAAIMREATQPGPVIPRDLVQGSDAETALSSTRELVGKMGRLLMSWPQITEAARRMRTAGRSIATRLQ